MKTNTLLFLPYTPSGRRLVTSGWRTGVGGEAIRAFVVSLGVRICYCHSLLLPRSFTVTGCYCHSLLLSQPVTVTVVYCHRLLLSQPVTVTACYCHSLLLSQPITVTACYCHSLLLCFGFLCEKSSLSQLADQCGGLQPPSPVELRRRPGM